MKSAVIAFLSCLFVLYVQGQSDTSKRCRCSKDFVGRISIKLIKGEPVVHLPSIFCLNTEIIITTTADKQKCVNPKSPLGRIILKNMNKHRKNGAVSMTTTSSQTNTQSSTSLHTTSTM
ncbi:uncharacterized protein LOC122969115 isoform X4 [Scomber scombrus]|uniref:Uncharacterized protein LOC122969115 isoform X4 n=1 Tax=Scomber scombrus TaxID=13677 RepID=A0AAV1Q2X1_SCOSC